MGKNLATVVLCIMTLLSVGPVAFDKTALAQEVETENRRGKKTRSRRTLRKRKRIKRKGIRLQKVKKPRSRRAIKRVVSRKKRRGKKAINPYFLKRAKSYPGLVNGYLPGHKKRTQIPFTARHGVAYFEGDIVLGPSKGIEKRLSKRPKKKKGSRGSAQSNIDYLWPGGVIPYLIDSPMLKYKRTMRDIEAAIAELNQKTHLKIVPWSNEDNYVKIVVSDGCSSWVGMQGGMQEINLAPWTQRGEAYCGRGSIIHEFLHAAGLWHTQSRPDREKYVTVHRNNIEADYRYNFDRRNDLSYVDWLYGLGARKVGNYEISSIMHYGSGYFAKDYWGCVGDDQRGGDLSLCSILTKEGGFIQSGRELTANDIQVINTIYPESTPENEALEALRRSCKLAVRKFCRTADDVITCLVAAKKKKARTHPGEPFGDSNACRSQLNDIQDERRETTPQPSRTVQSADLIKLKRYCPRSIRRFCRRAKDPLQCLLKAKRNRAKRHPGRPFGDNNRCRKQLKKMAQ